LIVPALEGMFGIVEQGAREPTGPGHVSVEQGAREPTGPGHVSVEQDALGGSMSDDSEVLPEGSPELFEMINRPVPNGLVVRELELSFLGEPPLVASEAGCVDRRL
jgi:hypothetical protein